uniref:Uncharacterized protein n=1 Tax=Rhizophora mucronata TaxID=61149 RepID=A0A2P2NGI5_RHIMU
MGPNTRILQSYLHKNQPEINSTCLLEKRCQVHQFSTAQESKKELNPNM